MIRLSARLLVLFLAAGFLILDAYSVTQIEPQYLGKPLSYWVRCIQERDEIRMSLAFEAIAELGPEAWPAVPALTRIISEPFLPVRIGVDDRAVIEAKLMNIKLRDDAIDGLAAIGGAAAVSAGPMIQWALTVRVIPARVRNLEDDELFVDLVAIDVLERMRVAIVIPEFGRAAYPAVVQLLSSMDPERRKLAVAILRENALPVAAGLLKSRDCAERKLGTAILVDMWPVVPREHLDTLMGKLMCETSFDESR